MGSELITDALNTEARGYEQEERLWSDLQEWKILNIAGETILRSKKSYHKGRINKYNPTKIITILNFISALRKIYFTMPRNTFTMKENVALRQNVLTQ